MSGYTPKRFAGTTARQRFGARGAPDQTRTAAGREENRVGAEVVGVDPTSARKPTVFQLQPESGDLLEGVGKIDGLEGDGFGPTAVPMPVLAKKQPKPPAAPKENRADFFPNVSTFDPADMKEAVRLMEDDIEYQAQEEAVREARKRIKDKIAGIAKKYSVPGMRYGQIAVYYSGEKTRKTLDKLMLVEAGVAVETIMDCYKESKPWEDVRIVDLSKPKKGRGGSDDDD